MKTITGKVISAEPISLSGAATLLSRFASSDNGATQGFSAYLRRASAAFNELKNIHREIKSSSGKEKKKPRSDARRERDRTVESSELSRAKGITDLVENEGKSETVSEEVSIHGREQDEIKEDKKKKKKKKKSKEKKEEDVVDGKVREKLEEEQRNEERKEEKKKKKSKNKKEDDVVDRKVKEKLEDEQRNQERKEKEKKKKKRKSNGEMGSEESKSKKKRKSKEIDG